MKNAQRLLAGMFLIISSCCQKENIACTDGRMGIHVVGNYRTATPMLIRYTPDNSFDVTIDTLLATFVPVVGTDSAFLSFRTIDSTLKTASMVTDSFGTGLVLGYDYKIFFPEDTLSWTITNLYASGPNQMEMTHCGDKSPAYCIKNATSCVLNGVTISTNGYSQASTYSPFYYIDLVR